jgi:AcrR family transcriptional regulator
MTAVRTNSPGPPPEGRTPAGSLRGEPPADDTPRGRLLQAARDVVAADGIEGLTLRAIARRAGVSHGAPLRHFPTLAALLAAVAADGFTRLMATIAAHVATAVQAAAAAGTPLDARQRLAVAGRAYVAFAIAEPGVYTVMFRPDRVDVDDPAYQAQGTASFGQLVAMVEDAQAEGWHPDDRPEELAGVLWANVHGVAELTLHGALPTVVGEPAPDRVLRLFRLLVLGVDDLAPPDALPDPVRPVRPPDKGDIS